MGAISLVLERNVKPLCTFRDRKMVLGQMFNDTSRGSTDYSGCIYLHFLESVDVLGWGLVMDRP